MPRTMTSTASGNVLRNFVLAALLEKRQQPERQAERRREAERQRRQQAGADDEHHEKREQPEPAGDHQELLLRPGQAGLVRSASAAAGFFGLLFLTSRSFSVSSTCSRRDFCCAAADARRPARMRATLARRCSACALARQQRIEEHPGDAADRGRHQDEQRERLHLHGGDRLTAPAASATFGGVERGGQPLFLAVVARAIPELRPADAGRAVRPIRLPLRVLAGHLVDEQVLRDDDVAFHADHFGDVGDLARAVAQARRLHHDVDRGARSSRGWSSRAANSRPW